jgi:hypothetical protein
MNDINKQLEERLKDIEKKFSPVNLPKIILLGG